MSLEQLVRPFARPDTLSRRRIIASNTKVEVQPAILSWGTAGSIDSPREVEAVDPLLIAVELKKDHDEFTEPAPGMRREVERVRVENPDDPNQYVMVERIRRISFQKPVSNTLATGPGSQENVHPDGSRDTRTSSVDYVEQPAAGYVNVSGKIQTVRYTLDNSAPAE